MPLRRLTNREYNNTIRDLLGQSSRPADQFPDDRDETFGFRRAGSIATQDAKLVQSSGESLAAAAVKNLATLLPCSPQAAGEAACAKQFIESFGLKAYRRPLVASEVDRLAALYSTGRTALMLGFNDAIGLVIEGMLQSAEFLYHWESVPGAKPVREGAVVRLGPYEMASRLSYFIWGSMPDADLFAAAAADRLGTANEVEAQARRMLKDPRSRESVLAFFSDLLHLDDLEGLTKPQLDANLAAAMRAEATAFFNNIVFEGDGRWSTLLGANYSFVNQALAGVYGVSVTGTDLAKTALAADQRSGFLTQPGLLALTSSGASSDPPRRGKFMVQTILCRELPAPPANVPPAAGESAGGSTRQRFEKHSQNPCAKACHGVLDPLGFSFEHYDTIGKYRTMDNGVAVDSSGSIDLDGTSTSFMSIVDLSKHLADSSEARGCFATQWIRFALQRNETTADSVSVNAAAAAFKAPDMTVRDLMVTAATARSFRYRSPSPGEVLP